MRSNWLEVIIWRCVRQLMCVSPDALSIINYKLSYYLYRLRYSGEWQGLTFNLQGLFPVITVVVLHTDPDMCGLIMITRRDTTKGGMNKLWAKYNVFKGPSSACFINDHVELANGLIFVNLTYSMFCSINVLQWRKVILHFHFTTFVKYCTFYPNIYVSIYLPAMVTCYFPD